MVTKETNRNPMTIHGDRGYGYQVVVSENLEWVCCCGQGHQEAKSPKPKSNTEEAHRAQSAPRGALRSQSRLDA